jgi:hypothetical protein
MIEEFMGWSMEEMRAEETTEPVNNKSTSLEK